MSDLVMPSSGHQTLSGLLMAIPAIFTTSPLTVPPGALGRVLVGAQPEERGLTKLAVGGPLRVDELGNELGPHPGRVFHARRGIERRLLRAQPLELCRQHVERLLREAGADLADVAELRPVVEADEERAEVLPAAFPSRTSRRDTKRGTVGRPRSRSSAGRRSLSGRDMSDRPSCSSRSKIAYCVGDAPAVPRR